LFYFFRDSFQNRIATIMAIGIVHTFKKVYIDHQY